jgi:hypothetical protein
MVPAAVRRLLPAPSVINIMIGLKQKNWQQIN